MSYTIKNKKSLFTLLIVSLFSLILTSNIINILDISYELKNNIISVLINFSILNMCYLKFNIILRLFNLIFKVIPFYIKNRLKIEYINYISINYLFLNLFYTFVSLIIIYKINYIIITNYNIDYYDYVNIYTNLIFL
uniref:hypothetical protein n=1 Tax=Hericium alpestre TaxID=135208 RepID=UPI00243577F3|nr:hypothetical protein QEO35_mgp31 [Hericium alpestre]WEX32002.1 hypothetical protein [Hericium alpestre]